MRLSHYYNMIVQKPCKAVIFDMDGTILDTLCDLTNSVNHALSTYNLPTRSVQEIRSFLGNGMKMLIHLSVPEGTPNDIEAAVCECHKDYYALHCSEATRPYDGIFELLRRLHAADIRTAVVSNKSDIHVQELVTDYFDGLLDCALGVSDAIPRKPAPDMVYAVMKSLGVEKDETVYVGDSEVDIETARNSGLPIISVTWGFRDRAILRESGAEIFADQASDIAALILDKP